jgi:cell division protein FtsW
MAHAPTQDPPAVDSQWVTLIFIAVILGLVAAFSASYPEATAGSGDQPVDALAFFKTQFIFALVGLAAGWGIGLMRTKWLRALALPGLLACFGLMLAAIVQGSLHGGIRGSFNYLNFFGLVTFQPSELAKPFYLAYVASLLARGSLRDKTWLQLLQHPLTIACGLFCLLLLGQHDMGMALLVVAVTLAAGYLGGMKGWRVIAISVTLVALAVGAAYVQQGEHWGRIVAWHDPVGTKDDNGYQVLAMLVGLARGGMFGQGLGDSPDKWGQMPEAHTDAIFCVMGGELGFLRLALFVVLTGWIVKRALEIGHDTGDPFGAFLASVVGIMFAIQTLINMAVATKIIPVTGLTLPFISCGGSSLISCLMAAGMVLAVHRYRTEKQEER